MSGHASKLSYSAHYNVVQYLPTVKADFISTEVKILVREYCGYLLVKALQECVGRLQDGVDGTVSALLGLVTSYNAHHAMFVLYRIVGIFRGT